MSFVRDMTGEKYGFLEVVEPTEMRYYDGSILWKIKCHRCGKYTYMTGSVFRAHHSISCGCYKIHQSRKFNKRITLGNLTVLFDDKGNKCYIDTEDYPRVKNFFWTSTNRGYFITFTKHKKNPLWLHRFILDDYTSYDIDHKNRKRFDNRKKNLRPATRAENVINRNPTKRNTSGYTGVCRFKKGSWRAYITVNGSQKSLGVYTNKEDAISARIKAEIKYFGEYSPYYERW